MKKSALLCLVLALLLACSVTAAFAAGPKEAAAESPENAEPTLAEVETLHAASEQMTADLKAYEALRAELEQMMADLEQELGYTPVSLTAQSSCTHPNLMSGKATSGTISQEHSESEHLTLTRIHRTCPDCNLNIIISEDWSLQPHNFGADRFISSNHLSPDPSNHTFTYSHTCLGCNKIAQYTVPSGCRKGNCIDPYSLTPEP